MDYFPFEDVDLNAVLQEAYRGKSKELLELEDMIAKNRERYYSTFRVAKGYYTDKELIKIGDKIADIFGFKLVDFNIQNDPAANAFTLPCGYSTTSVFKLAHGKEHIDLSGNVPKYRDKDFSCMVRVTSGLWSNDYFTNGEVMGIILHELGHNFQQEMNEYINSYSVFLWAMTKCSALTLLAKGEIFKAIVYFMKTDPEIRSNLNNIVKRNGIGALINIIGGINGIILFILREVESISDVATLGIGKNISNFMGLASDPVSAICSVITAPIGKGQENLSDTFATDLGYGPELSSALLKMEASPGAATYVDRVVMKLPLINSIQTLVSLPFTVLTHMLLDPHPFTGKRISNMVYELEKEIKRGDMSPAMKKEMQAQINDIKKIADDFTKVDSPLSGTALKKGLIRFTIDYNKDPKGFVAKHFSKNQLDEAVAMMDAADTIDFLNEINLSELF